MKWTFGRFYSVGVILRSRFLATKDLSEPRDAARSPRRNTRAFASLPYLTSAGSCDPLEKAFQEDADLLTPLQGYFRRKHVVLLLGDFVQQAAIDRHQYPECRLAIF